ncbi:MHJ_0274 family protein [Mycoplasma phocoenae]|uniref:DUF4760 domain-containing protein n=1 Tax=Mycoplasma phocoenae TaxID=754517 RepID=A0A858U4Y3_9MOLU|nr:hypothetical protein [Mycoplasma phocoenae]QJG67111.1 hypothetical protein HGG69_02190 [Mycoplasma phocoenae]
MIETILLSDVQNPYTDDNGGFLTRNIGILLLAILLGLIFIFVVYKTIKGMYSKKKAVIAKKRQNEINKELYREYIVAICEIIRYSQKQIDDFEVSIGQYKMSEVNNGGVKLIHKLLNRDDFKDFRENDSYEDFVAKLETFTRFKPTVWKSKLLSEINYFENLESKLEKDTKYFEYQNKIRKSIEEKYYE